MVQGELFREDSTENLDAIGRKSYHSFLTRHRASFGLDKIVILFLIAIVSHVLTFSVGVEKGKQSMEGYKEAVLLSHADTIEPGKAFTNPEPSPEINAEIYDQDANETLLTRDAGEPVILSAQPLRHQEQTEVKEIPKKTGHFTVQLVTYYDQKLAERETNRLKEKGYESFVIPSGKYFQVCTSYFDDRSEAKSFLREFPDSSRYPDAYVRPVVR